MGQSLIVSWTKLIKNGDIKNAQEALQAIETKVALMLQLLIHEDDDISSNIIGFCYDYLHILKQVSLCFNIFVHLTIYKRQRELENYRKNENEKITTFTVKYQCISFFVF